MPFFCVDQKWHREISIKDMIMQSSVNIFYLLHRLINGPRKMCFHKIGETNWLNNERKKAKLIKAKK